MLFGVVGCLWCVSVYVLLLCVVCLVRCACLLFVVRYWCAVVDVMRLLVVFVYVLVCWLMCGVSLVHCLLFVV